MSKPDKKAPRVLSSKHVALICAISAFGVSFFIASAPPAIAGSGKRAGTTVSVSAFSRASVSTVFFFTGELAVSRTGKKLYNQPVVFYWQPKGSGDLVEFGRSKTVPNGLFVGKLQLKKAGAGRIAVKFPGNSQLLPTVARSSLIIFSAKHAVSKVGPGPLPKPAPVPVPAPAPPPPAPSPPAEPVDPLTPGQTLIPAESSTLGIAPGHEICYSSANAIGITPPSISAPTGTYVYVLDKLFGNPTGGTSYTETADGEHWYNTAGKAVSSWINLANGQSNSGETLDLFYINSGYTVHFTQYIWDNNIWYYERYAACSF